MIPIKITFLGTSNAMPTHARNHPATLLEYGPETILFDCGEGTQRQLRIAKINPNKITHLVITHLHGDHILGIPGLLATLGMSEYQKTLIILGPKKTKEHFALLEKIYGKFNIKYEIIESSALKGKDFQITPAHMQHGIETLAYSFVIKSKLKLIKSKLKKLKLPNSPLIKNLKEGKDIIFNGKKIRAKSLSYTEPGKKITFITDTKFNTQAIELAKDSDAIICESTYSSKEKAYAKDHMHLTAEEAATIAKKSHSKKLFLMHISQRYESMEKSLESEAKKIFKNTKIVKDFEKITI